MSVYSKKESPDEEELLRLTCKVQPMRGTFQLRLWASTCGEVLASQGVRPVEMDRLHAAGILSFPIEVEENILPQQEAELEFLSNLVRSGCDIPMIRALLSSLDPPYAYDAKRMVFDFSRSCWREIIPVDALSAGEAAIEMASSDREPDVIAKIGQLALSALLEISLEKSED